MLIKWKRDKLVGKVLEQEKESEAIEKLNTKKQQQRLRELE